MPGRHRLRTPTLASPHPELSSIDRVRHEHLGWLLGRADLRFAEGVTRAMHERGFAGIRLVHIALIRNVSRSCRRVIILDLVRHRIPLTLFRVFLSPFLNPINAADGQTSIKRAYTPREMRAMVEEAVKGSNARVEHTVALFQIRQVVDITWP